MLAPAGTRRATKKLPTSLVPDFPDDLDEAVQLYSIVAHPNRWLSIFPMWYSVVAVLLYSGFALFLKTRTVLAHDFDS